MSFGFGFGLPSQLYLIGSPTLNLNLAGATVLDPIVTFTRASSASYYNSLGLLSTATTNTPRFDYNPATLAAQGLLIEEQRTNLLLYSEEFGTVSDWTPTRTSVTVNAAVSPAGSVAADALVIDTTAATNHSIGQSETVTSGTTYTWSVFAKANQITQINLRFNAQFPAGNTFFDLSAGTLQNNGAVVASSITPVGNGWYRCTFTQTASATGTAVAQVFLAVANAITIATANGTDNVLLWGAQLEAGAFPTSYIPTVAAQVTRAADLSSVNTLSPWYNASEGTLYVEGTLVGGTSATFPYMAALVGANVNNDLIGVDWTANNSQMRFAIRSGGVTQSDITGGTAKSANSLYKVAGGYAANNVQAAFDGTLGVPDTSATIPTITSLLLGGAAGFQPSANTWLRRITYYPRRLSNTELQSLTT